MLIPRHIAIPAKPRVSPATAKLLDHYYTSCNEIF